ncbi:group II intron reverse transcriptase/maturase [Kosmotoga olearia]|uniref:RNA-directed DNA polymerase (Reverse transcriptase) n=1 Tax=Kosmotoga olearia (strain ATCC BAA-1733 / DSM 21960 / TBF 19.5.1) TaxID=521045 RepID=C5CJ26_KOSOT|nr:group II intron reverse transcriptase/maturase [Kosmotoga olearia]ACR79942.1 RNA-directed DNA polymerase (Reverse transcriptase) [Kosmotoga olearia TBF 19.5.1]
MRKYYSLIDKVYLEANLVKAYHKVRKNNGAPGIDGVTVQEYGENLLERIKKLSEKLRKGEYRPSPVKRVEIPKGNGKTRMLGIPTVEDRIVQQSLKEIMEPIFEEGFHPSSYGYRKGRNPHQAVEKAYAFACKYKMKYVVQLDLSQCFDTLDHEKMIDAVAERISDGKILRLIRSFLKSGVITDQYQPSEMGSPQGGVISPLLSNIYLNKFDQKMMARGIRIVRYADDILIFAKSYKSAEKYLRIAIRILEKELKLKVNKEKTRITTIDDGIEFLGFTIQKGKIRIQEKKMKRFKAKAKTLTRRNQCTPIGEIIKRLNQLLRGFSNYYKIIDWVGVFRDLMGWIRRRLRAIILRQWKTTKKLRRVMRQKGYRGEISGIRMNKWRSSRSRLVSRLLPNKYFQKIGLYDMKLSHVPLSENPILNP